MNTRRIPVSGGPSKARVDMVVNLFPEKIVCQVWIAAVPKQHWESPVAWLRTQVPELNTGHWGFYKQYDNESGILTVSFRPYTPQASY